MASSLEVTRPSVCQYFLGNKGAGRAHWFNASFLELEKQPFILMVVHNSGYIRHKSGISLSKFVVIYQNQSQSPVFPTSFQIDVISKEKISF